MTAPAMCFVLDSGALITSDYDDIDHLVDGRHGIIVQDVGKL
jgi:hypothetical protein